MKRFLFSAFWILGLTSLTLAQWTNDPWNGMTLVTTQPGTDQTPQILRLSSGYFIVIWERLEEIKTKYQLLNPQGVALLGNHGQYVINGSWQYGYERYLIPDGLCGAICVFTDTRDGSKDVYGQRFDSLGNRLWGDTGLPLVIWPGSNQEVIPMDVTADSLGNFFVSVVIDGGVDLTDLYVQKFLADGTCLWGPYGVPECVGEPNIQHFQQSVPDMTGGLIDVWMDGRAGTGTEYFYVQHLDPNGLPLLTLNGNQVLDISGQPTCEGLWEGVTDGYGGGVWCCTGIGGPNNILYLFRLNEQGRMQWDWSNYSYCEHWFDNLIYHPFDGTIWLDVTENPGNQWSSNLYRFDNTGTPLFGSTEVPYGGDVITPTSDGGVITAKVEELVQGTRLWAHRVTNTGTTVWASNVALGGFTPGGGPVFTLNTSITDGYDGMVIAFVDYRQITTTGWDISAQRILNNGQLGNPTPNPHRPDLPSAHLDISGDLLTYTQPLAGEIRLELYDLLGRKVQTIMEGYRQAGVFTSSLNTAGLPSGLYFLHLSTPAEQQTAKVLVMR